MDKEELGRIKENLESLGIEGMPLDPDDDRDRLIQKLNEVNEKLLEKLERLETVVEQTVDKAYQASKRNFSSHREWDNDQDEDIKARNKKIKQIQATVNADKKKIATLKLKLASISSADRLIKLQNEYKDSERIKTNLEIDVATMERNIRHQQKYLNQIAGDTDYESKIDELKKQLQQSKDFYKQTI